MPSSERWELLGQLEISRTQEQAGTAAPHGRPLQRLISLMSIPSLLLGGTDLQKPSKTQIP